MVVKSAYVIPLGVGAILWAATLLLDNGDLEAGLAAFKAEQYHKAYHLLAPLASAGEPKAQLVLAHMYECGLGVHRDSARADGLYKNARSRELSVDFSTNFADPCSIRVLAAGGKT